MVRKKIDIKLIDDKSKQHTTFTKRRQGLEKKAEALAKMSASTAAVMTFSNAGNCYVLGHPDVVPVLDHYEAECSSALAAEPGTTSAGERVHGGENEEEEEDAQPPLTEVEKRIAMAVETGRWDEAVRGLGVEELDELFAEVENIKRRLMEARHEKITVAEATTEDSKTSLEEEESEFSGGDSSRSC